MAIWEESQCLFWNEKRLDGKAKRQFKIIGYDPALSFS